ncbi:MAG TPA: hypothetical protein VGM76_11740 [Lacipirellulaceae bacterium]|jgi:hypothetical protein
MAVTKDDLRNFQRFADEKLDNGESDSLVELASEWEAQRRGKSESVCEIDLPTLDLLAAAFPEMGDVGKLQQALARRGGVTTLQLLSNAALAADKSGKE